MKPYLLKAGYCFLLVCSILSILGVRQTEAKIGQLDNQARLVVSHAKAVGATQMQPALSVEALYALTRADAQIAAASFSNENYAVFSKKFSMVCDAKVKAESAESSLEVSNETVLEEMANRPGMVGRLVIPSVGVNVALFSGSDQAIVDAQDSAAYFSAGNSMVIGDHWNQGYTKIKNCAVGTKAYIYRGDSIETLTCTNVCRGINNDYDILYEDGTSATTGSWLLMYTCNGANYHDITITIWS